jgi:Domain of unknown function (DUF427)
MRRSCSTSPAPHYDVGDVRSAAWSYRAPFEEVTRIADLVCFYPEQVTVTIDSEKLEPVPGHDVVAHRPDRTLSVDDIGRVQLVEHATSARTRA